MEAHTWEAYYQFCPGSGVHCFLSHFVVKTTTWPTLAAWEARKYGRVI